MRNICKMEGCDKPVNGHGLCRTHYERWRQHGDPTIVKKAPGPVAQILVCTLEGCGQPHCARGLCSTHYARWRKHGTTELPVYEKPTCAVEDCDRLAKARGWCSRHYERAVSNGDPLVTKRPTLGLSLAERLNFYAVAGAGCWGWNGQKDRGGYSRLKYAGKSLLAHRVSYEVHVGPIPAGLEVDHLCRNRECVNPDHLEPVTPAENVRRRDFAWKAV